jgi:hypothetical protein
VTSIEGPASAQLLVTGPGPMAAPGPTGTPGMTRSLARPAELRAARHGGGPGGGGRRSVTRQVESEN